MIEFITIILSLVMLIVFFIMSSNISDIKRLMQKQAKQNEDVIILLKGSRGQMTDEEKVKAFDQFNKK